LKIILNGIKGGEGYIQMHHGLKNWNKPAY